MALTSLNKHLTGEDHPEKAYILQGKKPVAEGIHPIAVTTDLMTANFWSRSKDHRSFFTFPIVDAEITEVDFRARGNNSRFPQIDKEGPLKVLEDSEE